MKLKSRAAKVNVAQDADLDDLQKISQIDAKLARLRADASAAQLAGGAHRMTAVLIFFLAVVGMMAALALIVTEKQYLLNPTQALVCDVNSLIGCGSWIGAWQNEVFFGISNAVIGFAAFSVLSAVALVLAGGGQLPRFFWQLLAAGASGALLWLLWFMYQSFFVKAVLCPYCIVVWIVTLPIAYILISRALQAEHFGREKTAALGRFLVRNQAVLLLLTYFSVLGIALVALWDAIIQVL